MRISSFVIGMFLVGAAMLPAEADSSAIEVSLNPGVAIPLGSTGDVQKNSASLDAQIFCRVYPWVQIGAEVGYMFGAKMEGTIPGNILGDVDGDGKPDPVSFTSDIDASTLHVSPEIKVGPVLDVHGMKVNPYVIGGGGYYRTHYSAGTLTLTGQTSSGISLSGVQAPVDSENDSNGGWNVGGGLSVQLLQNLALGFDVRYHRILYKNSDDIELLVPSGRLTFTFGWPERSKPSSVEPAQSEPVQATSESHDSNTISIQGDVGKSPADGK